MTYIRLQLFSCFLFVASSLCSQEPRIKKIFTNLNHTTTIAIAQDTIGNIWFGGWDSGLTRYDGTEFKTFLHSVADTNSPASNDILGLAVESKSILWIATAFTGLDRYDMATGRFTHYRHDPANSASIPTDSIGFLMKDHTGDLWMGTALGVCRMDRKTGRFTLYQHQPGVNTSLSFNHVRTIYEDKQGTIWVGCGFPFVFADEKPTEGGLNKFDRSTGKFTRYLSIQGDSTSLCDNKVSALFEDSKGNFWVGTGGQGLHLMDRKRGVFKRFPVQSGKTGQPGRPPLSSNPVDHILFIAEDVRGGFWISTLMGGICRYDPQTQTIDLYGMSVTAEFRSAVSLDPKKRMDDQMMWTAFQLADHSLLFSTSSGNLFSVNSNFSRIPFYDDSGAEAYTFYVDSVSNNLWVGTSKGLMQETRDGQLIKSYQYNINDPNSICYDYIAAMRPDSRGRLWLAASLGLSCFNPHTGLAKNYLNAPNDSNSLAGVFIRTLAFDKKGRLWIGGIGDSFQYLDNDNGVFTHYRHSDTDSNTICTSGEIFSVIPDSSTGNLWVATEKGIDKLDPASGRFTHFLKNVYCRSVFIDHDGVAWAAGDTKLYRMRPGENQFSVFEFTFFDTRAEDIILHIMEDNLHNLWLGTKHYLLQINASRTSTRRYGMAFGIHENKFSWGINYKAPDGKLYFGDQQGHYAFYPDRLPPDISPAPQINMTALRLKETEVLPGKNSVLPLPIWDINELTLHYDQNVFTLDFIAPNYLSEKPNRYFYSLENYDNNWHSLENNHTAMFVNIPPGEYIFHARVVTDEGNTAEKSLRIRVTPPWWKTKLAYIFYFLIFLAAAFFADKAIRNRIIEKERARSRDKELQQAKEIEKAYTELKLTQSQLIQAEKMASLGQLTAGIAHEMQNPLNFVNNFSDLNQELIVELKTEIGKGNMAAVQTISDDIAANEAKINIHGKRADAIVKSMLQHSRAASGTKQPTSINFLCEEYLRLSYAGFKDKEKGFTATIKTDFDPSAGMINIVPQDIGKLLVNLFDNAFYTLNEKAKRLLPLSANGSYEPILSVQTRQSQDRIELTITDNGNGIPPAIIDKIFQPFFTTRPPGQGTGLGLSLAYDIVKAHGGEIKVNSKPGEGTEFIVQLPVH